MCGVTEQIESKRSRLEKICNGKPDALYLLSGISRVIRASGEAIYKPGGWDDIDWKGFMSPGKAKALALLELAEAFPDATIVVNSNTFNTQDPQAPTDVEVMAKYLERMGIDRSRMITQDKSTTTLREIMELIVMCFNQNDWSHVVVVAGETQLPPAKKMLERIETIQDHGGTWRDPAYQTALEKIGEIRPRITFVSAEGVLPIRNNRYQALISLARETKNWKKRENRDRDTLKRLEDGSF